jgi:hypothetical protein
MLALPQRRMPEIINACDCKSGKLSNISRGRPLSPVSNASFWLVAAYSISDNFIAVSFYFIFAGINILFVKGYIPPGNFILHGTCFFFRKRKKNDAAVIFFRFSRLTKKKTVK